MKADSNTIQPSEAITLPVHFDDRGAGYFYDGNAVEIEFISKDKDERKRVGNYIALCINEHPRLSAEVTELKAEVERLKAALERLSVNEAGDEESKAELMSRLWNQAAFAQQSLSGK